MMMMMVLAGGAYSSRPKNISTKHHFEIDGCGKENNLGLENFHFVLFPLFPIFFVVSSPI